eukprot:2576654-Pleurochrysis_carterae.AAC.1
MVNIACKSNKQRSRACKGISSSLAKCYDNAARVRASYLAACTKSASHSLCLWCRKGDGLLHMKPQS